MERGTARESGEPGVEIWGGVRIGAKNKDSIQQYEESWVQQ